MSIAHVIRNSGELLGIHGAHFKKCFKLSLHRDDPAIVEL